MLENILIGLTIWFIASIPVALIVGKCIRVMNPTPADED